jgi:hypothetical protein
MADQMKMGARPTSNKSGGKGSRVGITLYNDSTRMETTH